MLGRARLSTVRSSPTTSTLAAIAISAHQRRLECCASPGAARAGTVVEIGWDTMRVTIFWMSQGNESYYQNDATLMTARSNQNHHLERTVAPPPRPILAHPARRPPPPPLRTRPALRLAQRVTALDPPWRGGPLRHSYWRCGPRHHVALSDAAHSANAPTAPTRHLPPTCRDLGGSRCDGGGYQPPPVPPPVGPDGPEPEEPGPLVGPVGSVGPVGVVGGGGGLVGATESRVSSAG